MRNYIQIKQKINSYNESILVSSDKSISIRSILLASQAIGISKIFNLLESEDVINTLRSIKKLGIKCKKHDKFYKIYGLGLKGFNTKNKLVLNAGNSGTFARLILGLLVNSDNYIKIVGDRSLSKRDFSRVVQPLKKFGPIISSNKGRLPVTIKGTEFLRPIDYVEERGSAQCKSTIMLAALKTPGRTKIKAKKSRNHSEIFFKNLNIPIKVKSEKKYDKINVYGESNYKGFNYRIPGDISSCSFFIVLTILNKNSKLLIRNVNVNDTRTGIIKILNKMNAKIKFKNVRNYKGELIADIIVKSCKNLKAINCPEYLNSSAIDEFVTIFLIAAKSKGISTFKNLGELEKKESPRLTVAVNFLKKIGIKVLRKKNNVKIYGKPDLELKGNYIIKNFHKDHRIFMMSCVAALTLGGNWKLFDKDSINSSFPDFFNVLKKLGVNIS